MSLSPAHLACFSFLELLFCPNIECFHFRANSQESQQGKSNLFLLRPQELVWILFFHVCAGQAMLSQCCRVPNSTIPRLLVIVWCETFFSVEISHGLCLAVQQARPEVLHISYRLQFSWRQWELLIPLGRNGKQEARSPAGARCQKAAEGLGLQDCKSSGARELRQLIPDEDQITCLAAQTISPGPLHWLRSCWL